MKKQNYDKVARHIYLSWYLLECKALYYLAASSKIDDATYDGLEKEYDTLCNELNLPNSVADMVDFDTSRPSCRLVMDKLGIGTIKKKK